MATSQVDAETSLSTRLQLSVQALQMRRKVRRQNYSLSWGKRKEMGRFVPADAEVSQAPAEEETVTVLLCSDSFPSSADSINGTFRHILYVFNNTYIVPQCWTQLFYRWAENRTESLTH